MLHASAAFKGGNIRNFWEGGGNLIWGDLAFYGGDFRNHSIENISHGTPKFIIGKYLGFCFLYDDSESVDYISASFQEDHR